MKREKPVFAGLFLLTNETIERWIPEAAQI